MRGTSTPCMPLPFPSVFFFISFAYFRRNKEELGEPLVPCLCGLNLEIFHRMRNTVFIVSLIRIAFASQATFP